MKSQVKIQRKALAVREGDSLHSETRVPFFQRRPVDLAIEDEATAPPAYTFSAGDQTTDANGVKAQVGITDDGRFNINIDRKSTWLSRSVSSELQKQLREGQEYQDGLQSVPQAYELPSSSGGQTQRPPILNIVIHVVGSRGDVQPFIALGCVLKQIYKHRVRLATHPIFQEFVEEHDLEFFSIGGNPAELMAYMVKNPGLLPRMDAILDGNVRRQREGVYGLMKGCWRSCVESGNGLDPDLINGTHPTGDRVLSGPFVADLIIANPPSFAHIHCAQKLGVPLHLMFTMPWSPTQVFPHPLANIQAPNNDSGAVNYISYALVETLVWLGLGSTVNKFRSKVLGLEPIRLAGGSRMASRLRIPYTYCWSSSLIPRPHDWASHISVAGFFFLPLAVRYVPDPALAAFLDAGPPPIYIGFGSIVVDDPDVLTELLFEAISQTGHRALISKGWASLGSHTHSDRIFVIGDVPHDWLFERVACIVHHGGAGTTAAATARGKPSVIVPFFGDQSFWGEMVWKSGIGPRPIAAKALTADLLARAIQEALQPSCVNRARELGQAIATEKGAEAGAASLHNQLDLNSMRCSMVPDRAAVWKVKRRDVRLSALAATALLDAHLLRFKDLELQYELESGAWDPITAVIFACLGMVGNMSKSLADIPVEVDRAIRSNASRPPNDDATRSSLRDSSNIALGVLSGFSKGIGRILLAGFKSPFEVALASAKGFHNAPLLYGDRSVRKLGRITGVVSGLEVVGKELGFGFYDGVSGVVTHTIDGGRKEGAVGYAKGFGIGLGGLVLKPVAAAWGIPGYTFEGIYKEVHKLFGSATKGHVALARLAQGSKEYNEASVMELQHIVEAWHMVT